MVSTLRSSHRKRT